MHTCIRNRAHIQTSSSRAAIERERSDKKELLGDSAASNGEYRYSFLYVVCMKQIYMYIYICIYIYIYIYISIRQKGIAG